MNTEPKAKKRLERAIAITVLSVLVYTIGCSSANMPSTLSTKPPDGAWVPEIRLTEQQSRLYVMRNMQSKIYISNSAGMTGPGGFLPTIGIAEVLFKDSDGREFLSHGTLFFGVPKDGSNVQWAFAINKNEIVPDWVEKVGLHYRQFYLQNVFFSNPSAPSISSFDDELNKRALRLLLVGTTDKENRCMRLPAFK